MRLEGLWYDYHEALKGCEVEGGYIERLENEAVIWLKGLYYEIGRVVRLKGMG